jgi:uroporphyrinogen-III decarboxylase
LYYKTIDKLKEVLYMNYRERVLCILQGKTPDCVPWFGDLDYWIFSQTKKNTLPEEYHGDGLFKLHRDLGVGFYLQGFSPFKSVYKGIEVIEKEYELTKTRKVITPYGEIDELWRYLPESYTWALVEHFIKSSEDMRAFKYWLEHTEYEPNYDLIYKRKELIGDLGMVLCYTPKSPLMDMVVLYAGVESTIYCEKDEPDEFKKLMDLMEFKNGQAAQIVVDSAAELIMIPENLSSEVVGKRLFELYMRPYEKKWIKKIKDAGKYSLIHMDGTLRGLVKEIASTGFNVIEAMTTAPVGDIPLEDLHNWVEEDTIIWGGLPGIYFTDLVSDEDFETYVKAALKIMIKKPRYVLGVADQVPPGGIWERIKKVSELVEKYGRY